MADTGETLIDFSSKGRKTADGAMALIALKSISVMKDFNPRFKVGDIDVLQKNIAKQGLINPLTVRPTSKKGKFELLSGHRRLAAMKALGREDCPVMIRTDLDDDTKAKAFAIAENSEDGRTNLTYVEMGSGFVTMQKEGWGMDKIAGESGVAVHTVRRALKIMELDTDVLDLVQTNRVSPTAALAFVKLPADVQARINIEELEDPSAHLIRRLAQDAQKALNAANKGDEKGEEAASGERRKGKVSVNWRSPGERNEAIEELAHAAFNSKNAGAKEARANLVVLYWVRGQGTQIGDLTTKQMDALIKTDNKRYIEKQKQVAEKAEAAAEREEAKAEKAKEKAAKEKEKAKTAKDKKSSSKKSNKKSSKKRSR